MTEQSTSDNSLAPQQPESNVLFLIKKMQQQLDSLEKKIDILINQSQARPSGERPFNQKPFSKPFRPFDRSHHRSGRDYGNSSRGKNFDRGRPFEKRPGEENQGFGYKKKSYDSPREGDSGQRQYFGKPHSGGNKGFDQKKKPFYLKRKG